MNNHVDSVSSHSEKPSGLDYFKALVHHRSRIDADFAAHVPFGMLQSSRCGCRSDILPAPLPERPSGGSEMKSADGILSRSLKALENGRMLGIHRKNRYTVPCSGLHHNVPRSHQGFLVGKGNSLSGLNGCHRRPESAESHHCGHNDVDVVPGHKVTEGVHPAECLDSVGRKRIRHLAILCIVVDYHRIGIEPDGLFYQQVTAVECGEHLYLEEVRMLRDYIKRLPSD